MDLFLTIISAVAMIFGFFVFFAGGIGNVLAGSVALFSGMYAYDTKTFMPLIVGYGALWLLRLLGFEKR